LVSKGSDTVMDLVTKIKFTTPAPSTKIEGIE